MPLSQSNQKIDLALAIAQLRSHNIQALFQTLGWHSSIQGAITLQHQRCVPVAQKEGITVWQVILPPDAQLVPALEHRLYEEIAARERQANVQAAQQVSSPLVIFVDAEKTRSLWCAGAKDNPLADSALYVAGQPIELWRIRLKQLSQYPLSQYPFGLFADAEGAGDHAEAEYWAFAQLLDALCDGISGISNREDKNSYALLTLQRLIFIQSMQQKGWLNGDVWYLQNRFGKAAQTNEEQFFVNCLQPLYRALSLPEIERPLALVETTGMVPFLERIFDQHPLEEKYSAIAIADWPFEDILGWLSEQSNSDALNPLANGRLSDWLARYWELRSQPSEPSPSTTTSNTNKQYRRLCSLSLDTFLRKQILSTKRSRLFKLEQFETATVNNLLFNANVSVCRHLIREVLPSLRILDPACGSGGLLSALNYRLVEIFALLTGYIQQTQDAQLKIWQAGLKSDALSAGENSTRVAEAQIDRQFDRQFDGQFGRQIEEDEANLLLGLQQRVLKNNLYGVDIVEGAVETARFQLLLATLALTKSPKELTPLPDLSFNILTGNSLIGFIKVDEKRFDQVNTAGTSSVLQGNLLQPLAADGYKTTLAEKNLALEHYKSRNEVLAAASIIPAYARASLLKEEISQLDTKAQDKLNALLLNYMSEQLGIQYKTMQLADKPQRRLLTEVDISRLQPFHWGYHFNSITERGGFDVIACMPPHSAFKPTAEEFVRRFPELAIAKKVDAKTLRTSKQALSKGDPEVTQTWMVYHDTYAYAADYFYRSEQYAHQNLLSKGKAVRNQLIKERLFVERCLNLLALGGVGAIALKQKLSEDKKAQTLWALLQESSECTEESASSESASSEPAETQSVVLSFHKPKLPQT